MHRLGQWRHLIQGVNPHPAVWWEDDEQQAEETPETEQEPDDE
jgi:hypothetical protein